MFGCLRYQAQLDYMIGRLTNNRTLDPEVQIVLRMGMYQLRYLERIPPHAAVSESVELMKRAGKASAAPLVNAVMRKVNRNPVPWPDRATELSCPPGCWRDGTASSARKLPSGSPKRSSFRPRITSRPPGASRTSARSPSCRC